jgi:signal transduction protein with GAF and PtsI domain
MSEDLNLLSDPTIINEIKNNTEKGQKAKAILQQFYETMKNEEENQPEYALNPNEVKEFYKQICLRKMDYLVNYDDHQIEDFKKKAIHLAEKLLEI